MEVTPVTFHFLVNGKTNHTMGDPCAQRLTDWLADNNILNPVVPAKGVK